MTKVIEEPQHGESSKGFVNQDELILEQQRQIDKEVATAVPLVGKKESIDLLVNEYKNDAIYTKKAEDLKKRYNFMRRMRPDGNCFFRAFIFSYLEYLIADKNELERASGCLQVMDMIDLVSQPIYGEQLEEAFNIDDGTSDYVVVYMRLLTSSQIRNNADLYQNFLEGGQNEVEPMYRESDHVHIHALSTSMGVGVRVMYMDRTDMSTINMHNFPDNCDPIIHLLYRPGHYDVLYSLDSDNNMN